MTDPQDPEEQTPAEPPVIRRYGPGIRPKKRGAGSLGGSLGEGFFDEPADPELPEESAAAPAPPEAPPPPEDPPEAPPEVPPPPVRAEAEPLDWGDPYDTGPRRTLGVSDPLDWDEHPDPPPRHNPEPSGTGPWPTPGTPEAPSRAEPSDPGPRHALGASDPPGWDEPSGTGPWRTLGESEVPGRDESSESGARHALGGSDPSGWDEPSGTGPWRTPGGPEAPGRDEPSESGARHALGGSDLSGWDEPSGTGPWRTPGGPEAPGRDEPSDAGPRHALGGADPSGWDEPSGTGPGRALGGSEVPGRDESSGTGARHALGGSDPLDWGEPSEETAGRALGGAEPSGREEVSSTGPRHALGGSEVPGRDESFESGPWSALGGAGSPDRDESAGTGPRHASGWDEPSGTGPRQVLSGADPAVAAAYQAEAAQTGAGAESDEGPGQEVPEVPASAEGPLGAAARRGLKAADRMVGLIGFRYPTAALMLLAVLALYGVATLSRPDGQARAGAGVRAPVPGAVLACPAPAQARLSALAPASAQKGGKAEVLATTKDATPVAALPGPGANWFQDLKAAPDSYTVRALGPPAAGLEVERTIHFPKGDDRGLAGVRCTPPGVDQWFLGSGPVEAKDIDLYLTNVDAQPAAVDVSALSGEGPLDTTDGRGVPVDPYTTKVIHIGKSPEGLGTIVTTARVLGLRVRAGAGRVSAAVRVRIDKGKGVDWMPLSPRPATSLVVPGLPGGGGLRRLLVAVPGEADARIKVQAITSAGAFAPAGQDTLDAPAQTVTPLDLEKALTGKPAAIRLTSDHPIVAGFTAYRGADVAYGAATEPLGASGGVVADNRFDTSVLLTAPDGAATVRITGIPVQGQPAAPQEVKVAAGRTLEVRLAAPPGAEKGYGALIVPVPGSGPVHAARVLSTGKDSDILFTVLPVVPALTTVLLPPVADSQTALTP